MSTDTEVDYLERYEAEREEQASREERRRAMHRAKERQLKLRRMMPLIVAAGAIAVVSLVLLVAVLHRHAQAADVDEIAETEQVEAVAEDDTALLSKADAKHADDVTEEETGETDPYIDAEYGPYAEIYSEEKDLFWDGYTVSGLTEAAAPPEDVMSTYALLIDADDGTVISARDADVRIYPASMTKIMTVLVAAEHITDPDAQVLIDISITDYVYSHDASAVGFSLGEHVTVRDLMYGTILPSGADAAIALAEYVAGSEDRFVDMMNDKLEELGLSDTAHFTNCVGIYNDDHYCTLTDMAMIMKAAVENDLARQVMREHIYTTSSTPEHPEGIEISNWFLRRIEDKDTHGEVICAKTGYVKESGCCGASYQISNEGKHYICVTADAWSSWRCIYDHVALYEGFTN